MTKTFKKIAASVMAVATFAVNAAGMTASARYIKSFSNIRAYVSSQTKVSDYPLVKTTSSYAVFNYSDGNAYTEHSKVTAVIKNSNGVNRGSCTAVKGERKVFSTSASIGYEYDLFISKTNNGDSILVSGSWSPDVS